MEIGMEFSFSFILGKSKFSYVQATGFVYIIVSFYIDQKKYLSISVIDLSSNTPSIWIVDITYR